MSTRVHSVQAWRAVRRQAVARGGTLTIPKAIRFPHPRDAGAHATTTWPIGQYADYAIDARRVEPPLVIREFADRFEAFVDGVQLSERLALLIEQNPRTALYAGGALLGAGVAAAIGKKREAALLGAGLGLVLAALLDARLRQDG